MERTLSSSDHYHSSKIPRGGSLDPHLMVKKLPTILKTWQTIPGSDLKMRILKNSPEAYDLQESTKPRYLGQALNSILQTASIQDIWKQLDGQRHRVTSYPLSAQHQYFSICLFLATWLIFNHKLLIKELLVHSHIEENSSECSHISFCLGQNYQFYHEILTDFG